MERNKSYCKVLREGKGSNLSGCCMGVKMMSNGTEQGWCVSTGGSQGWDRELQSMFLVTVCHQSQSSVQICQSPASERGRGQRVGPHSFTPTHLQFEPRQDRGCRGFCVQEQTKTQVTWSLHFIRVRGVPIWPLISAWSVPTTNSHLGVAIQNSNNFNQNTRLGFSSKKMLRLEIFQPPSQIHPWQLLIMR